MMTRIELKAKAAKLAAAKFVPPACDLGGCAYHGPEFCSVDVAWEDLVESIEEELCEEQEASA